MHQNEEKYNYESKGLTNKDVNIFEGKNIPKNYANINALFDNFDINKDGKLQSDEIRLMRDTFEKNV